MRSTMTSLAKCPNHSKTHQQVRLRLAAFSPNIPTQPVSIADIVRRSMNKIWSGFGSSAAAELWNARLPRLLPTCFPNDDAPYTNAAISRTCSNRAVNIMLKPGLDLAAGASSRARPDGEWYWEGRLSRGTPCPDNFLGVLILGFNL